MPEEKDSLERTVNIVRKYGTKFELQKWNQGFEIIESSSISRDKKVGRDLILSILSLISERNKDITEYQMTYLQFGPETIEEIEKRSGKEVASCVKNIREGKCELKN